MKKRTLKNFVLTLAMSLVLGLAGCGVSEPVETDEKQETKVESSVEVSAPVESTSSISDNMKSLVGEWTMLGVNDYAFYSPADNGESATLVIYEEDGKVKADYAASSYAMLEIYGTVLTEKNEKAYPDSTNSWSAEFGKKIDAEGSERSFKVTREGDVLHLIACNQYSYEYDGETLTEEYQQDCIYVKRDNPNAKEIMDSYRYKETITVSNVKELFNAIGSGKRIILKAGEYNLSQLPLEDRNNDALNYGGYWDDELYEYVEYYIENDAIYMSYLNNICLEGEAGAEVRIVTEECSEAPINFSNCENIVLRNLTLGHAVEPGTCSGSVVYLYDSYHMTFEDCRLFGCGTYGFDASGCSDVTVNNCDIYECSDGLLYVINSEGWQFKDCTFRDTNGYSGFNLWGSWNISFDNCTIKNNSCMGENCLICANEYDSVTFRSCTFKNNSYAWLYEGGVYFEECVND